MAVVECSARSPAPLSGSTSLRAVPRLLAFRLPRLRHLADPWVTGANERAGQEHALLEVLSVGGKHLPSRLADAEHADRAEIRQFAPERGVVLLGCRDPNTVVAVLSVAQGENDSLLNIDRSAAKHRPGPRIDTGKLIEHEFEWDRLRLPDGEEVVWISAFDHADKQRFSRDKADLGVLSLTQFPACDFRCSGGLPLLMFLN